MINEFQTPGMVSGKDLETVIKPLTPIMIIENKQCKVVFEYQRDQDVYTITSDIDSTNKTYEVLFSNNCLIFGLKKTVDPISYQIVLDILCIIPLDKLISFNIEM